MKLRVLTVFLVLLVITAPFILSFADHHWQISRTDVVRRASYEQKCMMVFGLLNLALVLCTKIVTSGKTDQGEKKQPLTVPEDQDPRFDQPREGFSRQRRM